MFHCWAQGLTVLPYSQWRHPQVAYEDKGTPVPLPATLHPPAWLSSFPPISHLLILGTKTMQARPHFLAVLIFQFSTPQLPLPEEALSSQGARPAVCPRGCWGR